MAISVIDNFEYKGAKPLDARLVADSLVAIQALDKASLYEGAEIYAKNEKKYYMYDGTDFVERGGGGGSTTASWDADTSTLTLKGIKIG